MTRAHAKSPVVVTAVEPRVSDQRPARVCMMVERGQPMSKAIPAVLHATLDALFTGDILVA